jgi:hypothetical protein
MTQRPRGRTGGHARRSRPIRRASAGLSAVRAGAALAMLASAGAIYGLAASPAFAFANIELSGVRFTDAATVRSRLAIPEGANLFGLRTELLEASLANLPTVLGASVEVRLPDTVAVAIQEREPILVWRIGDQRFLVDREGALFARVGADGAEARGLRTMDDRRAASVGLELGSRLDPVDLDAAARLGALRPSDVGSRAEGFRVIINDENGFVLAADPYPEFWLAIFGFYTPTVRTTELVPGQVELLRQIIVDAGEARIAQIILASATDGTYVPKESPQPSSSPRP